jgi:hypothetical protein
MTNNSGLRMAKAHLAKTVDDIDRCTRKLAVAVL